MMEAMKMRFDFKTFITENNIEVPKLQREFAFGREDKVSEEKRRRFIDAIFTAMSSDEPLYLNFIYGTSNAGVFVPLDGQQRLTILFLLHWYFLAKEKDTSLLKKSDGTSKFIYDTRYSSTVFFNQLVNFLPEESAVSIVNQIKDMPWFELSWNYDANISGCLNVLDYIQEKDVTCGLSFETGKFENITFDKIDIDAYEMSDDIYIKINSRGKQLTEFENFKAAFLENIKQIDSNLYCDVAEKFDNTWTKVFWQFIDFESEQTTAEQLDKMLFKFIKYIAQVFIWERELDDDIDVNEGYSLISNVHKIFTDKEDIVEFVKWFDAFVDIDDIEGWFAERFYKTAEILPGDTSKIRLWQEPNLLKGLVTSKSSRNQEALFYALAAYLMSKESIPENDFLLRFRSIRNLLEAGDKNSYNNALRYSPTANDMTGALKQIKAFMKDNFIVETSSQRLRKGQFEYEVSKNNQIQSNLDLFEAIVELEDNNYTHGITQNIGYSNVENIRKYTKLLKVGSLELVKILLSYEYHFAEDRRGTIYFPTNSSDRSSFYRSATEVDVKLIEILEKNTIDDIVAHPGQYIKVCHATKQFTSSYYAIKYPKYFIENTGTYYERGNVRNFINPGICITNKSLVQWHNFRNSALLTIAAYSGVAIEWMEDGSGISWNNGSSVMDSTEKELKIIIGDQVSSLEVQNQDNVVDSKDRIELGINLIKNNH